MFAYIGPALVLAGVAQAHIAAFAPGMYCTYHGFTTTQQLSLMSIVGQNGSDPTHPNFNNNLPVDPLYNLTQDQWWFQHDRGCDKVPPPPGQFLELPAGGSFNVDLANNQAFSQMSYGGSQRSEWPDGG
jgi:hypothetical protein